MAAAMSPADILTEFACQLTALVILAARDKIRQEIAFLRVEPLEQQVLAVDTESLGRGRQGDDFQVGELRDDTSTRYIAEFVNTIPSKMFVDVENFTKFAMKLCMSVVIAVSVLIVSKILITSEMHSFFIKYLSTN